MACSSSSAGLPPLVPENRAVSGSSKPGGMPSARQFAHERHVLDQRDRDLGEHLLDVELASRVEGASLGVEHQRLVQR
ncbi:MAG: hypothetical protein ACK52I_11215, partial [Pseudomonadota bacterium]